MMMRKKLFLIWLLFPLLAVRFSLDFDVTRGKQNAQELAVTIDHVIASGFTHPVQITHAGDGSGRLFVVEQPGTIRIIDRGTVRDIPFLDITNLTDDAGEQGLLGLAFHPDYPNNGYLYVDYTRATDGKTVVARYRRSGADPNLVDPDSAKTILTVDQPYGNHNGGQILFGPDGYLYVGLGDGGSGGDPLENAQDPNQLLGSILRIDVDGGDPYAIPADNPYVGRSGRDEIWAIGLRNPWRFSFDRETGDVYIGDVGQNAWEEIDFYPAWGASGPGSPNYGWDCLEGTHQYEWTEECDTRNFIAPIAEYSHDVGRSVTGGFVYRGLLYPNLEGLYFYADYVSGRIWRLSQTDTGFTQPLLALDSGLNISAFGEDENGELYVVDRAGTIRRLADVDGPAPPPDLTDSIKRPSPPAADPGETITYTLTLINTGRAVTGTVILTDTIPIGLNYLPGSLTATSGTVDGSAAPTLTWEGIIDRETTITLTYQVSVTRAITGSIVNQAVLSAPGIQTLVLSSALFTPRSHIDTTIHDLFLPGTQPSTLSAEIPPSVDCDICHSEPIYDAWRGTMMSQSARDPLMWAALEAANADAGFNPDAVSGDYCLRCHAPKGWLEGRSHPADGSVLNQQDIANGVACALCHRMVDPQPTGGETEVATIDQQVREALTATVPISYTGSASLIIDPEDRRRGPFAFDLDFSYHSAYQSSFLGQSTDPVTHSRLCGTCHNVDNPLLSWDADRGEFWSNPSDTAPDVSRGDLFPIETTFTEWRNSAYPDGVVAPQFAGAKPDDIVAACQDCHLQRQTGIAADPQFAPVPRDCQTTGCLPEHQIVGGNTWIPSVLQDPSWRLDAAGDADDLQATAYAATQMLGKAARISATLTTSGPHQIAVVRVTNNTGHKLPTGYPEGRQMWVHLRAYDAAGNLVFESGQYDHDAQQLIRDTAIQVYEAKQGLTENWAAFLDKRAGASFHFLLNNTVIKDNRIPPKGYEVEAWKEAGISPVGAAYANGQYWDETLYILPANSEAVLLRAALYYQTASREYVDFLRTNGGVDGKALFDLWEQTPSTPTLMALYPKYETWFPIIMKSWYPK
jgi:uncharacterized repeat protein (TIGR01451 family)